MLDNQFLRDFLSMDVLHHVVQRHDPCLHSFVLTCCCRSYYSSRGLTWILAILNVDTADKKSIISLFYCFIIYDRLTFPGCIPDSPRNMQPPKYLRRKPIYNESG